MSKKIRDYLFIIFIVLFILGTILTSLYASGFKINYSWPLNFRHLLIKTGMIDIKTKPEGATIYLNKKRQTSFSLFFWKRKNLLSPNKIKGILPGEYTLTLELKNYIPFQKKIKIYPGQNNSIGNINLFRDKYPQLINQTEDNNFKISYDKKYLYLPNKKEIIKLENNKIKKIKTNNSSGFWLKNTDKLLINGQIFNTQGELIKNYQKFTGSQAHNWFYDENNNRLYYQISDFLGYLDITTEKTDLLIKNKKFSNYQIKDNNIFLIISRDNQKILQNYSIKNKKIVEETKLPPTGNYILIPNNNSLLTLYDTKNKTLYLINPQNINKDVQVIRNISDWQWINNESLFYNNNWEIYHLNLKSNKTQLLNRVGEKINKIIWNKKNDYLIFSTINSLNIYDLKIGINTKVLKNIEITNPLLNQNNNTLYFWSKIKKKSGIYKLMLQ